MIKNKKRDIKFGVIIFLVLFYSCTEKMVNMEETVRNEWVWVITQDSLSASKEINFHELAKSLLYENCTIKNGKIEIVSKQEWQENGYPEILYEKVKQVIDEFNERNDILSISEGVVEDFRKNQEVFLTRKKSQ